MADEPFFVSKPSGHEVKPLGVAKEFTLSAMDDRNREQWALYSSFLMVASLLVGAQSGAMAAPPSFDAPSLLQAEQSALAKKKLLAVEQDLDLVNPAKILIDNPVALFSVDVAQEQQKRTTQDDQLLVEQSLDSGLRAMATEFISLTNGDAAALDLEPLSSSPLRSLIEQVARGVGKSFNEVATILQTIYGHLDFIIGTRQTPLEPILGPLIESPAGQSFMDLLDIGRQFPGPQTPDFDIAGILKVDGGTNSLYAGSDKIYFQSSLNRTDAAETRGSDSESISGLLETGAFGAYAGVNWREGLHFGQKSDGGETFIVKTGNIDQDSPVVIGQEIAALDFLSLSGENIVPEELGSAVGDFLPYDIDLESTINTGMDMLLWSAIDANSTQVTGPDSEFSVTHSNPISTGASNSGSTTAPLPDTMLLLSA